jgi:hypothetical protein
MGSNFTKVNSFEFGLLILFVAVIAIIQKLFKKVFNSFVRLNLNKIWA